MAEYMQVVTTAPTREVAMQISRELVRRRAAACVQVLGGLTSTYWWEDQLETSDEWLCMAKTRADLYDAVERIIVEMHPYDVPEVIAMPIEQGSRGYLEWIDKEVENGERPA